MPSAAAVSVGTLLLLAGCSVPGLRGRPSAPSADGAASVAVLPFRADGALSSAGDFVPGPAHTAPTGEEGAMAARGLSAHLGSLGMTTRDADVVAGATERTDTGRYGTALARRVAERVQASFAVLGTLIRYQEREGTAWGVRSPASVEYHAALVRASDGATLLVDRFAYTQQPLSENLLDLPRFLRGGGRWLTREEILDGALHESAEKIAAAAGRPPPASGAAHPTGPPTP